MRLYYGFVTATTVLAGLACWHLFNQTTIVWTLRDAALIAMGFFAWGFNQIFSDWFDRKEDAINAPHRPMVTGELASRPAFALSALGLATIAAAGFMLSPWTLAFLAAGGALNIAYSLLKRVPVLNCFIYACAISCCALFAIAGAAERCPNAAELRFVACWILPVHFLMCHNSYYKDVAGDRAAGVRTLQTLYHRWVSYLVSYVPCGFAALMALELSKWNCPLASHIMLSFLIVALGGLFLDAVEKAKFHRATCLNCQLCVTLLHLRSIAVTWPWALVSIVAIQLLFLWYDDEKE